jgi:hypothetical protein
MLEFGILYLEFFDIATKLPSSVGTTYFVATDFNPLFIIIDFKTIDFKTIDFKTIDFKTIDF